jgi:NADH-quinone oxidoreductase subunit C
VVEEVDDLVQLHALFGEAILEASQVGDELRLRIAPERLAAVCEHLRDSPVFAFDYPADLAARDTGEEIVLWYRLVSMGHRRTALIHVSLPRDLPEVESATPIWPGLNWHERECFDLFGVRFRGHPDQDDPARMRILLPEDWEGHPFRRDYEPVFTGDPLHGPQERN